MASVITGHMTSQAGSVGCIWLSLTDQSCFWHLQTHGFPTASSALLNIPFRHFPSGIITQSLSNVPLGSCWMSLWKIPAFYTIISFAWMMLSSVASLRPWRSGFWVLGKLNKGNTSLGSLVSAGILGVLFSQQSLSNAFYTLLYLWIYE